jgi:hypothetical protein
MLQEFGSSDGGGNTDYQARDSLQYSALGMVNSMHTRYLMNFGHWNNSADAEGKAAVDRLMRVGAGDIAGKLHNGYWSRRNGNVALDYSRSGVNSGYVWFYFMEALAVSQGLMNKTLFSTNWQLGVSDAPWAAANNRWTVSGFGFTVDKPWTGKGPLSNSNYPNRVLSAGAEMPRALIITNGIDEIEANNFNYEFFSKLKVKSFGNQAADSMVGVMFRATDADNCYVIRYRAGVKRFELIKRVYGEDGEPLAESEEFEISGGDLYTNLYNLRVVVNGNNIKLVLGYDAGTGATLEEQLTNMTPAQIELIDYTDGFAPILSGSKIGFFSENSDAMFDDAFITETR